MRYVPFLSEEHWPFSSIHDDLYRHFLHTRYYTQEREYINVFSREALLTRLESNEEFLHFWTYIQEEHSLKKDYFLSLMSEDEPCDYGWINSEFEKYRPQKAFEALSEEERRNLQNEIDEFRPASYRAALEGEALRLNCDVSDVKPTCFALPWRSNYDEESPLVKLPDDMFGRVMLKLDTIDIFRMTLVCREWRSLIHNSSKYLKRAEHALTTHIITFKDWMDPPKTPICWTFFRQYQLFSWCLAKWYCGISENLETLILDHPVPYVYLATLLKSCPKLKRLHIADDRDVCIPKNGMISRTVHLRQLEVFLCSNWGSVFSHEGMPRRHLLRDVLVSSECLRVFKGSLNAEDCSFINARRPLSIVFSKLVALDLRRFTASTIEILAQVDNLQLRFLRFGTRESICEWDTDQVEERIRDALHQLLPKLAQLEILITSTYVGITNNTIQLLVDLELNLRFAVLHHAYFYDQDEHGMWDPSIEIDPLQSDDLTAFQDMLLSNNPTIELSNIHFVLVEGETMDSLVALETGFTLHRMFDKGWEASLRTELYYPQMQQRLGIPF